MIGAIEMMKKPSYVNIQESSYDQNGIKKKIQIKQWPGFLQGGQLGGRREGSQPG